MSTMGKKNIEWQNTEVLTTPSHKRAYIESCKDWLLAMPVVEGEHEDEIDVGKQPLPVQLSAQVSENIGLMREHIYNENLFKCFICKQENNVADGKIINANPFTRAQYMLLCSSCQIN